MTLTNDVKVINGDCLEVMAAMEDQSIDALITDPPYCSGAVGEAQRTSADGQGLRRENVRRLGWFVGDNMGTSGLVFLLRSMAFEACRIVKPSGSVLIFCNWRMISNLQPAIESSGLRFQNLIVWDKGQLGLGTGFRATHETILHFTCGKPEYHDLTTGNVLRESRMLSDHRKHQTEKPVDLLKKLVRVVCPVGGVVLDPFAGSGSLGEACRSIQRRAILVERDKDYCDVARKRIEKVQRELFN